jgi:hypothetical protein
MIIDLDKRSITEFPFKELKMLISTTSLFFGGCLHKMYLLNPTTLFLFTFKIIEKIMDPETRVKINMLKKKSFDKMFENGQIDPCELTEEFGGTKVDNENYWPPVMMKLPDFEKKSNVKNIFMKKNSFEQESFIKETKNEPITLPHKKVQMQVKGKKNFSFN